MQYYGTRLSENISRREPEGYLLCLNVPVARTGIQDYLPEELGLLSNSEFRIQNSELSPAGGLVQVYRPEEEVFSPETVASFEGMPVTNDHPPEEVDSGNIRALQKGHAHNVRRGSGEESDQLLADLIITDPDLIEQILNGKREISCGYTYELCEENGQYIQRKIRGNHVAVVDAGRAGHRVSIKDEHPVQISDLGNRCRATGTHANKPEVHERRSDKMKKSLSKVLARMAKDGDIETVAGIIEEMIEAEEDLSVQPSAPAGMTTEEENEPEDPAVTVETPEGSVVAVDEDMLAGILERLDRIIALLEPKAADEAAVEEITEAIGEALETAALESGDPETEEVAAAMEELLDPVASAVLEPDEEEEEEQEVLQTGDALRSAIAALRPVLARLPRKQQRRMADEIAGRLQRTAGRKAEDSGIYQALASAGRRTAPASADLGKRIMEKRNISCRRADSRGGK